MDAVRDWHYDATTVCYSRQDGLSKVRLWERPDGWWKAEVISGRRRVTGTDFHSRILAEDWCEQQVERFSEMDRRKKERDIATAHSVAEHRIEKRAAFGPMVRFVLVALALLVGVLEWVNRRRLQ